MRSFQSIHSTLRAPDGDRFLIIEGGQGTTTSLRVVVGWFNELKAKVGN